MENKTTEDWKKALQNLRDRKEKKQPALNRVLLRTVALIPVPIWDRHGNRDWLQLMLRLANLSKSSFKKAQQEGSGLNPQTGCSGWGPFCVEQTQVVPRKLGLAVGLCCFAVQLFAGSRETVNINQY